MKFGPVPVSEAEGAVLAHAVKQGGLVLRKGVELGQGDIQRLRDAGVATVVVARLEPDDAGEDAAAGTIAAALAGPNVRVEPPATGRCNLFAEHAGVLRVDRARIDALNMLDESVTAATLPDFRAVVAGEMIGTVKIIPFAIPADLEARAARAATGGLHIAAYRPKRVAVLSTLLPGLKPSVIDKTLKVMATRLGPSGSRVVADRRVDHEAAALAAALQETVETADLVVVFGASAITDRADVIPAAIEQAGGVVSHFGMPVDPGNLLLVGAIGDVPVIGAPGCARSPRENGFDWVLQRMLADVPVTRADIQRMGVGGLLMEIVSRPSPRDPLGDTAPVVVVQPAPIGVVLLAAGRSTRMGGANKLLAQHRDKPLVRHAAEHALAANIGPVMVVTGHQATEVEAALAGLPVVFVHNPDFAAGMAASVKAGVAGAADHAGLIMMLGDMPLVSPNVLRRLAAVFAEHPEAQAVVPTLLGERGNPVLIGRALFPAVASLSGDTGARRLVEAAGAHVVEVPVVDTGVLRDIDTPEALAALNGADQ